MRWHRVVNDHSEGGPVRHGQPVILADAFAGVHKIVQLLLDARDLLGCQLRIRAGLLPGLLDPGIDRPPLAFIEGKSA